ncbi:AMP-binding protein [Streptomyces xiaopingdaonensis]|uniref:AMP-binding protein n=1 Tax=Streptomyces xiaopingdaonensis TaxID=1565415 RepID=UPI00037D3A51|nr:AMP-binding protein [Streptomyces xiaopingdaonensis]
MPAQTPTSAFRSARDTLLRHRGDYAAARARFEWPRPEHFNWALDWFDRIADGNDRVALHLVEEDGRETQVTFEEMRKRSNRVANWLRGHGVGPGDGVVLMLGNQVELWETLLALMKLRAVVIPATPLLGPADLADRLARGGAGFVVARAEDTGKFLDVPGDYTRISVGGETAADGWLAYAETRTAPAVFEPQGETRADDRLLLYFTSGTTALPKLVAHTHGSYPIGHLSTMYWIGLKPGDIHMNISSPGWAKHAYSSFFAPWSGEATIFVYNYTRFDAGRLMSEMDRLGVDTFCAPPTVWRMLIQADLGQLSRPPRELVAAGEPLNPEVIERVERAWGVQVRDGFGQTETSVGIGNFPGQRVKPGSMGQPAPGFEIALLDPVTGEPGATEGEISFDLHRRPVGVMTGYAGDEERNARVLAGGYYRTGDIGTLDEDGYVTYVGRSDDVFKASDYKVSPFELESALLQHEAVAEAAVVPSPDPLRLAVPKAYIVCAEGWEPGPATAKEIFAHSRAVLAPFQRVRLIEFSELPKTVSGKIRRVELRAHAAGEDGEPGEEYRD